MAENPAASRQPVLKPLSEVNHEPGAQTISTVVKILNAIMEPLTTRDWRYQDKVPQTGGVIFVPNHISNADPLAVGQYLAFSGRWPRFLAKASVFRIPVIGRIIAACGQIPVERGSTRSKEALVAAAEAIEQGRALVIYPEGTISYDPDFNDKSLRSNVVFRWEYKRGSTLYLVWNVTNSDESRPGQFTAFRDLRAGFGAAGTQVFMVKLNYWLGL